MRFGARFAMVPAARATMIVAGMAVVAARFAVLLMAFAVVAASVALAPASASAQCLLANPSFELSGSGGAVFAGWNQFGPVGSSPDATHGAVAARVTGPNLGGWDVAAFWQPLDCDPGEQWAASVRGWHMSSNPLTGSSRAILNIEWRDADDNLISYESYTVADASTPTGEVQDFSVTSGAAPTGTASVRLLLGVLQAPGEPVPEVFYDEATFTSLGPPTHEDLQWSDFPGGRTLSFSGLTWRVKGPGYYGPGPSLFSDDPGCVWVDGGGSLHLTISHISGSWYSTEVALADPLGYGDYIFTTRGRLDLLDLHAVLGMFIWEYGPCYDSAYLWWNPYNEFDIEFGRWGDPLRDIAQFVAQPYDYPGNLDQFDATFTTNEVTSHAFRWLSDRVECRSWRGGPQDESPATLIHSWTYTGPHIPRPEEPRVHLNLWQFDGPPSGEQEVVVDAFTFVPEGAQVAVPDERPAVSPVLLQAARPNPFTARTTLAFRLEAEAPVALTVFDVSGREVRALFSGRLEAGPHEVSWDGRDGTGRRVADGVYLVQLRAGAIVESRRVVRVE